MSMLIELETQYFEIENQYASKEFICLYQGQYKKRKLLEKKAGAKHPCLLPVPVHTAGISYQRGGR